MSISICISEAKREESERLAILVEQFEGAGGKITPLDPQPPSTLREPAIVRQILGFSTVRLISTSGHGFTVPVQTYDHPLIRR